MRAVYPDLWNSPLTLMRLEELLFGKGGLFSKVDALTDIVERGVLDYVAHTHRYESDGGQETDLLLKLAEFTDAEANEKKQ